MCRACIAAFEQKGIVVAQLAGTIVWLIVSVFLPVSACLIGGMCLLLVQTIS